MLPRLDPAGAGTSQAVVFDEVREVLGVELASGRSGQLAVACGGLCRSVTATVDLNWHAVCATNTIALLKALRYRDSPRARTLALSTVDDLTQVDDSHYAAFPFRSLGFLDADAGRWRLAQAHLDTAL